MKKLLLVIFLFTTLVGYAQQEIIGKIHTKNKTPLKQVKIKQKGTNNTVYTDQSGIFCIKAIGDNIDLVVQAKDFPPLELLQITDNQLGITMIKGTGTYTTRWNYVPLHTSSSDKYKAEIVFQPENSLTEESTPETRLEEIKHKSDTATTHIEPEPTTSRLEVIPAVYETVTEQYEIEPATTRLIAQHGQYETVTEQVMISDASSRLITVPDGKGGITTREETIPAQYRTITKRIVKTPATTREETIPAKYGTRTVKKLVRPATTRTIDIPAKYETVTEQVLSSDGGSRLIAVPDGKGGMTTRAEPIEAEYKTITKRVLVTPATTRTIDIPAKYGTREETVPAGTTYSADTRSVRTSPPVTPTTPEPTTLPKISNASILSATEINDFSKWKFWEDITENQLKQYTTSWKMNTNQRYCVQVKMKNGSPMIGAYVRLLDENNQMLWTARTDNTGKAELWASLFQSELKGKRIEVIANGKSYYKRKIKTFHKGINVFQLPIACKPIEKAVDIAFVVDATGSMNDEIQYIKDELRAIVNQTTAELPDYSLRLGSVFYRDVCTPAELLFTKDFTSDVEDMSLFISNRSALGGGDHPEALDHALEKAMSLNWRGGVTSKLLFVVLDAPPHQNPENFTRLQAAIRKAATMGVRIIPIGCSGTNKSTEYLMRAIALATNGSYVHLTDKSGVGGAHSTPTTDKIDNELLNQILIRQITQFSKIEECQPDLEEAITAIELEQDTTKEETLLKKEESQDKIDWSYYPNPTSGVVNFKSSTPIKWIHVLDNNGKLLKRVLPTSESTTEVNIGEFPSAVYLLQVFFEDGKMETGKVVVSD